MRGTSLLEVCFAIALITIAALGLAAVWIFGVRLGSQTSDTVVANELAHQLSEQIRADAQVLPAAAASFDGSLPTATLNGFPPAPYPSRTVDARNYIVNVTCAPVTGRADLKRVIIHVFWNATKSIELSTVYYVP